MSDSSRPHGSQPTRLLCPWDFLGKSTGAGCHCLLHSSVYMSVPTCHFTFVFPSLISIVLFSTSVSLFLLCKYIYLYHFSGFHIYLLIYNICFSLYIPPVRWTLILSPFPFIFMVCHLIFLRVSWFSFSYFYGFWFFWICIGFLSFKL